jgi:type VI secretion system protein ImpK
MNSTAAFPGRSTFPLVSHFFEFWEEVEALRREIGERGSAGETLQLAAARGRERLATTLRAERRDLAGGEAPGAQSQLLEAQYAIAAAADEVFIGLTWDGAESWRARPLEAELFGTCRAGQEIFKRIDRLLNGVGPNHTEMAAVYLTALEVGFRGRYADADDAQTLDAYESALRKMLGRSSRPTAAVAPRCYEHTIDAGAGSHLPPARQWWSAATAIAGISLLALTILAMTQFQDESIEAVRQRVERHLDQLAGRP